MPPKKDKKDTTGKESANKQFRWTPENDRKLLLLFTSFALSGDIYNKLVQAFPGTSFNGVQIRCSKLRIEQRKLYEELGWDLTDGLKGKKAGAAKAKGGNEDGDAPANADDDAEDRGKDEEKAAPASKKRARGSGKRKGGDDEGGALAVKAEENGEDAGEGKKLVSPGEERPAKRAKSAVKQEEVDNI